MREELPSGKEQKVVYHVDTYTDSGSHNQGRTAFCKVTSYLLPSY